MPADLTRFEDFELDAHNYCLRHSGKNLKLERIPLEILLLLAGRPGDLVTREEIVEKLWGKNAYLDTENAINTAIRKIRLALGDDPAQPRFVQTVTGRGYRFIARVTPGITPEGGEASHKIQAVPSEATATTLGERVQRPARDEAFSSPSSGREGTSTLKIRRRKRWLFVVLTTTVGALAVLGFILTRPIPMLRVSNYVQITNDGQAKQGPLVTDGMRLYFAEGSANHRFLSQVSASGGETSVLPNSLETPSLLDISPARSELLVASSRATTTSSVWSLPLPTGSPHRIGDLLADDGTWSPDGRDLVYVSGNDLYRARSDGTAGRKLVSLAGAASWPRWSPDGTRLRFTVTDNTTGFSSIWEISPDGKMPHAILPSRNQSHSECCGCWTPDGKYFVFQSTREGKTEIWAMLEKRWFGRTSHSPSQLTSGQMNSLAPSISSDARKLYVIGQQLRGELARYDSNSGQFVPYLSGISAEFADFSRDRKWVTYVSFPDHILWRSKLDGSERLQLTLPPVQAAVPRWSPDGKRIAFFDAAPGKPWKIHLISADGGTPEPVLNEPRNEMDPNWSPDGNALLFSYFPIFEKTAPESLGVYVVDLGTRKVRKLSGSDGLWAPRWSPDGRYVVTRSLDSLALMLFDFKTQAWTELTRGVYFGFMNWSSDGQYVYYLRRGREPAVLRIRIGDRKVEEVASLKDVRQTGFRGAIWSGLAPDDSPLVLRDMGTQEIYALDFHAP